MFLNIYIKHIEIVYISRKKQAMGQAGFVAGDVLLVSCGVTLRCSSACFSM